MAHRLSMKRAPNAHPTHEPGDRRPRNEHCIPIYMHGGGPWSQKHQQDPQDVQQDRKRVAVRYHIVDGLRKARHSNGINIDRQRENNDVRGGEASDAKPKCWARLSTLHCCCPSLIISSACRRILPPEQRIQDNPSTRGQPRVIVDPEHRFIRLRAGITNRSQQSRDSVPPVAVHDTTITLDHSLPVARPPPLKIASPWRSGSPYREQHPRTNMAARRHAHGTGAYSGATCPIGA